MASENKKNKGKNSYTYADGALKWTNKFKRMNFFNASLRQKLKRELRNNGDMEV